MKKSILAIIATFVISALFSSLFAFSAKGVIEIQPLKSPNSIRYFAADTVKPRGVEPNTVLRRSFQCMLR